MVRLVVFDLDGTLVDSRRDLANATNALLEEMGGTPLPIDEVASMVGEGAALLVRRALTAGGLDGAAPGAPERFLALYDERLLEHTRPYPGITDALDWLKPRVRLAVLTNKPGGASRQILAGLGLSRYFEAVVGGDSPFGRKPDPAGLLHLAQAADATPGDVLLVGDSAIDLETTRRAGSHICLARYGFGFRIPEAELRPDDLRVDSPLELVGAVEALLTR